MDSPKYKELQKAVAFVKQFLRGKIDFDNSIYSIRNLDDIFIMAFKDGKLQYNNEKFTKYKGQVLLGFTGYLTEVILKNTRNTKIHIDENDDKWYLNFTLTAENGHTVQPGQQVMKRASQGNEKALYNFCLATVKTFNEPKAVFTDNKINFKEIYYHDEANKKPWWKFW